ncbi:MAG: SDR family oxidoreductase [Candidatus Acidiferrales bacterium]
MMRVFVTGATGFIGSAVVKELIGAGHQVLGLARSDAGAKSLTAAGAQVHRGSLEDLESLRSGASACDGVIHTAFFHAFSHASMSTRLGVMFGGSPSGIFARFADSAIETDRRAIEELGTALRGDDRPLVVAFATMALAPGHLATEQDAFDPKAPGGLRGQSENVVLALASRGVRSSVLRLPPSVHDQVKQGFVTRAFDIARKKRVSAYIGDGRNRWPAVHRLDTAKLFRLALEKGAAGARYHAVTEEGIPFRDIANAIGRRLNVPAVAKSPKDAAKHFGYLATFVAADNPVSSKQTQEQLAWHPTQSGLLADLEEAQAVAA